MVRAVEPLETIALHAMPAEQIDAIIPETIDPRLVRNENTAELKMLMIIKVHENSDVSLLRCYFLLPLWLK